MDCEVALRNARKCALIRVTTTDTCPGVDAADNLFIMRPNKGGPL
jgi:hypothetical protein